MRYLVLLTPVAGKIAKDFGPYMVPEIQAVWSSYKDGTLREFYFSPNPQVVTLIYELPDEQAVHAALDKLPMIEVGLLDRRVVQLGPFTQFQALFDKAVVGD